MRANTYLERGKVKVESVADPKMLHATDAIVRVTLAGICGADLEFTNAGPELGLEPGMRLGHEFVGVIEEIGSAVTNLKVGDRVAASPMFVDGTCYHCRRGQQPSCEHAGLFGSHIWPRQLEGEVQGGQSEFVRVPFAEYSLFALPESLCSGADDAKVLPICDNFSTGFHGATMANIQPGETVVVIGDGPVGQSAVMAASHFAPGKVILVGRHPDRLQFALQKAGATHVVNAKMADPVVLVKEISGGRGANSVIDSVGNKESLAQAIAMTDSGASLSVLGFGHLYQAVDAPYSAGLFKNLRIHVGTVPAPRYIPKLLPLVENKRLDPSILFSSILKLDEAATGYELMRNRASGAMKVALTP